MNVYQKTLFLNEENFQRDVGISRAKFFWLVEKLEAEKQAVEKQAKRFNREVSQRRIGIEHVNRRCKIFRIAKQRYRGKHKNYGKVINVIAGLVNFRYDT